MNNTTEIVPHRITKPIQLLAAWLAGLAIVNGSFLSAAGLLHSPTWLPALLTIAAVLNVPLFIVSLFLLQTKFRPEMQEDTYYSKWLERKYSSSSIPLKAVDTEEQFLRLANEIVTRVTASIPNKQEQVVRLLKDSEIAQMTERFKSSRSLSELHLYHDEWPFIHDVWRESPELENDIAALSAAGLILLPDGVIRNAQLTSLGRAVAEQLESQGRLWNQQQGNEDTHNNDIERHKRANKGMQRIADKSGSR